MSDSELNLCTASGVTLPLVEALRLPYADLRVSSGATLYEVLNLENSAPHGHAQVVVHYNANSDPTGAVVLEYLVLELSPYVTFRLDGTVFPIGKYHPAMQDAMILDKDEDGGLKWVPIHRVEREEGMVTVTFTSPNSPMRIAI